MRKKIWFRFFSCFCVAAYMGLIYHLSSRPSITLPMWFPNQDKAYHFLSYLILGSLLANATSQGTHKRRFWIAFVVASLYGISDEFHQSFVPGRDCSIGDWLADTAGAWFGAYLFLKSESLFIKIQGPKSSNAPG